MGSKGKDIYSSPKIEFETRLASQTISPQEKANLWLFQNIEAMGDRDFIPSTRTKKYPPGKGLNACDPPVSAQNWKRCVTAVRKAQRKRDEDYLKAKILAQSLLLWYHSDTPMSFEEWESHYADTEGHLGLETKRLREHDVCPTKKSGPAQERDLETCQENLYRATVEDQKYKHAHGTMIDFLGQWQKDWDENKKEFDLLAEEDARERKKKTVQFKRRLPRNPELLAALEKVQEKKRASAEQIFLRSKAFPQFKKLFAYRPNDFLIPPVNRATEIPTAVRDIIRQKKKELRREE